MVKLGFELGHHAETCHYHRPPAVLHALGLPLHVEVRPARRQSLGGKQRLFGVFGLAGPLSGDCQGSSLHPKTKRSTTCICLVMCLEAKTAKYRNETRRRLCHSCLRVVVPAADSLSCILKSADSLSSASLA